MKKLLLLLFLFPLFCHAQEDGKGIFHHTGIQSPITSKTTTTSIAKTDSYVQASGNITLTLPIVTSADDGLSITVKHIGTYTDLIIIQGNSGATIDGVATTTMTRWRGRTFVANNGNWVIKEKETRADNLYDISAKGSFTTLAEAVAFLDAHLNSDIKAPVVFRLGGGTYTVASTIVLTYNYPVTFEGLSYGETTIAATTGLATKPMFRVLSGNIYFKMLAFQANTLTDYGKTAGEDCIRFNCVAGYHEVKDCSFNRFYNAIVDSTNADLWFFEVEIDSCTNSAMMVHSGAVNGTLKMANCKFQVNDKGIFLNKGNAVKVEIETSTFNQTTANDSAIVMTTATFTPLGTMFIQGNVWNNTGKFLCNFDFTSSTLANVVVIGNSGIEDKKPHCKINVINNLTTTTVATATNFVKANYTNGTVYTCKFTLAANKATYLSSNSRDCWIWLSGNVQVNQNGRTVDIAIVVNAAGGASPVLYNTPGVYSPSSTRCQSQNVPYPFAIVTYIPALTANDYVEIWVTSSTNGDVVILQDLTLGIQAD